MEPKISQQIAKELHKPVKHKFKRMNVNMYHLDDIWGADLVEMKGDKKYKYILVVIDIFTRYAWGIPLANKTGKSITDAFSLIFVESKRKPGKLWVDKGKEFYNKTFEDFLKENHVHMYSTYSGIQAATGQEVESKSWFAESLNKTLKHIMQEKITTASIEDKTVNWVKLLPDVINEYNNQKHSAIKMSPNEASKKDFDPLLYHVNLKTEPIDSKAKFKIFLLNK